MGVESVLVVSAVCFLFLCFGFYIKDWAITALAAIGIFIVGVDLVINGIPNVTFWVARGIGLMHWGIGGYILLRSSIDEYQNKF